MPHHHAGHQHIHKAPVEKRQNAETVVQYVYKTAAKTFDGPVGGYSTVNPPAAQATPQQQSNQGSGNSGNNGNSNSNSNSNSNQQAQQQQQQQQQAAAQSAAAASSQQAAAAQSAAAASSKAAQQQAASASASSQAAPSLAQSSSSAASSSQQISSQSSKSQTSVAVQSALNTPTSSSPSVAATTSAVSSPSSEPSSGGLSSGGKAGIAIVVILLVGLLAGLAFFFVRRKQRRDSKTDATYEKTDDEKSAYAAGLARSQSVTSTKTSATAPRLSIRPITQFLPDLAARGKAANAVAGAGLHDSSIASQAAMARSHENEKVNPFGDHAQAQAPNRMSDQATLPIQNNAVENPFGNHAEVAPADATPAADMPAPLRTKTPTPEGVPAGIAAGAVAGAAGAVGVAALAHKDHDKQAPRDRSSSPRSVSPTASEFSTTPSSPMANGAAPTNVHRVQLDFKPSMDDELALRAGDLVRLLHEYDDGWVRLFLPRFDIFANSSRPSASVSTALNKVSLLVPVSQLVR